MAFGSATPGDLPQILLSGLTGCVGIAAAVTTIVFFMRWRRSLSTLLVFSMVCWAIGQLMSTLLLAVGNTSHLAYGGMLMLGAAPLFVAGFLSARGMVNDVHWVIRCCLDTGVLTVSWLVLLWQVVLTDTTSGAVRAGVSPIGVAIVVTGLMVTSTLFIVLTWNFADAVRGASASLSFVAAATVAQVAPQAVAAQQALTVLGWTMTVVTTRIAIHRPSTAVAPSDEVGPTRVTVMGISAPILILLWRVARGGPLPVSTLVIAALLVLLLGLREVTSAQQRRVLLQELTDMAHRDTLTGLKNRRALIARLSQQVLGSDAAWVITFDVDRFKAVNTERGHTGGDAVLVAVAQALTQACGSHPGSTAFRLGGDEFVIVHQGSAQSTLEMAERARRLAAVGARRAADMGRGDLTLSAGVAPLTGSGVADALVCLDHSAQALRAAKANRDVVQIYTEELDVRARRESQLERRLREAVATGRLETHFQPIIHLDSQRVSSVEALARWDDDEFGTVSPDVFIAIAERTGLIHQVGHLMLTRALAMVRASADQGSPIRVAVNVSALQLSRRGFARGVDELLRQYRVPAGNLILEVTESICLEPDDGGLEVLQQLADLGITIALDDFGTGYSSFGSMTQIPASVIKIDRTLVRTINEPRNLTLMQSIISMTRGIGLEVVVEGIEDEDVAALVGRAGAVYGQGWRWAPAVPAHEVRQLLARHGTIRLPDTGVGVTQ